jgi:hypothetical protein
MADGSHRLAAQVSMAAAEQAEQARCDAFAPLGGDEPGSLLSDASPDELSALGMSADVERPEAGESRQAVAEYGHRVPFSPNTPGGGESNG